MKVKVAVESLLGVLARFSLATLDSGSTAAASRNSGVKGYELGAPHGAS